MSDLRVNETPPVETPSAEASTPSGGATAVIVLVGVVVLAVIFFLGLTRQRQSQPTSGFAPAFTLKTLSGEEVKLESLRGNVVVINFWASWCAPCRQEAAELEATWQAYKDKGVVFLGVAYSDTERKAREYLAEFGITYINGLDYGTTITEMYRITGVPETFVLDREGKVTAFAPTQLSQGQLSQMIEVALAR